jgi:hypothetical protein
VFVAGTSLPGDDADCGGAAAVPEGEADDVATLVAGADELVDDPGRDGGGRGSLPSEVVVGGRIVSCTCPFSKPVT